MNIEQDDLLSGEQLVLTKAANVMIRLDDHGLSQFAFGQYLTLVGMKGQEAIGGKLHLTNFRLIFKNHSLNRLSGKFSIFLPTIHEVKDTSFFIAKKMTVATQTQAYEFVVWGIPHLMSEIISQQQRLDSIAMEALTQVVVKEYQKCGDGLKIVQALETLNLAVLTARRVAALVEVAHNPLELSSLLNLIELLSLTGEE